MFLRVPARLRSVTWACGWVTFNQRVGASLKKNQSVGPSLKKNQRVGVCFFSKYRPSSEPAKETSFLQADHHKQ
jgi:hypothetical protein